MDHLLKATANGIRIYAAITTDLTNEATKRHLCQPLAAAALGRTMTGALLLAANLKNKECLTIKISGNGPLGIISADANSEGNVRGYISHPEISLPLKNGKLSVGEGVGQGIISITRFTGLKEPVTGSSELITGEIAEDITRYLLLSEQTPSSIALGVLIEKDFSVKAAGGFFIQPLPNVSDDILDKLEDNLSKIRPVSKMIEEGLDAHGIIAEVLSGFDINYLEKIDLSFKCQCSKRRTEDILLTLSHNDLVDLVNDGTAEVCCKFCGEKYNFNQDELLAILHVSDELRRRQKINSKK